MMLGVDGCGEWTFITDTVAYIISNATIAPVTDATSVLMLLSCVLLDMRVDLCLEQR